MDSRLANILINLDDEEFFELAQNINLSMAIRDLMIGENGFDREEIRERFGISSHSDMHDLLNGSFEFTTRHMGIVRVLQEEKDFFDKVDDDDEEEENDDEEGEVEEIDLSGDSDVPDQLNYSIFGTEDDIKQVDDKEAKDDKEEVITIRGDRRPIYESSTDKELKKLQDEVYQEYQRKLKESETNQKSDPTDLLEFLNS